ncbi:hypothetical protein ACFY1J_25985 [Streptomyces sp. NPDC001406]|uniref:hypothetical protein n=1 Tax=Streptomyces sp. NPDC001406 TaxID=3364572 RepID=UPI0036C7AEA8
MAAGENPGALVAGMHSYLAGQAVDAFTSTEKTLHANCGNHRDVPSFEVDSSPRFFARHLS